MSNVIRGARFQFPLACTQCGAKPGRGQVPTTLILGQSGIPILGSRNEYVWACANSHQNVSQILGRIDDGTGEAQ